MKKFFVLILTVFLALQASAQLKVKLAAKHFDNLAYFEAAPMYNELADKFLSKNKGEREYVLRAAISNGKIVNYRMSNKYYGSLLKLDVKALNEGQYMDYIDQLRMLEAYDKSVDEARKASLLFPENKYFKLLSVEGEKLNDIKKMSKINQVEVMPFNSDLGDFAPFYFENGLVFTTKSSDKGFLTGKYAWDDSFFTNIVYSENKDGEWTKPKALSGEFFSRKHDGPVAFNAEKNQMLVTRNLSGKEKKEGVRSLSLYTSIRNQKKEWGPLTIFPYSVKESNTGHGCYSLDGKRVYFISDREGTLGKTDIFYSDLKNGEWQEPVNFEKVNTEGEEMFPFVSKDNRLYFASNGRLGMGGLDIYYLDLNNENSVPVNAGGGINTAADDFGFIVNDTLSQGYLSSNRRDFVDRIYSWKQVSPEIKLRVNVFANYKEKEPIKDQEVLLIDNQKNDTLVLVTNEEGYITTNVDFGKDYSIRVIKPFFELDEKVDFNTHSSFNDTSIVYDMMMNPTFISARIHVIRESDRAPIHDAAISLYNPKTKKDTMLYTDEDGYVTGMVDRHSTYWARASKKGYLDKEASFVTNNYSDKLVELELAMDKIKKGGVFKLENIFYDLDKATLREESKVSLDKLASFLLSNDVKIELSSHTDSRGGDAYNMQLSQRRAQSCVDYLLMKGVPKSDIIAKGYGESKLVNRCKDGVKCSEDEHQANRRTEVKILEVN